MAHIDLVPNVLCLYSPMQPVCSHNSSAFERAVGPSVVLDGQLEGDLESIRLSVEETSRLMGNEAPHAIRDGGPVCRVEDRLGIYDKHIEIILNWV